MSQAGIISATSSSPSIPTSFVTNPGRGTAVPAANILNIITANSTVKFSGAGNTVTLDFGLLNLLLGSAGTAITSGTANIGVGIGNGGSITSGSSNTIVGFGSGDQITTSPGNSSFGSGALGALTTGSGNNVAIGFNALPALTTGQGNTCVGKSCGGAYTTTESENILIGHNVTGTAAESNVTRIGASQTKCFISGIDGITVVGNMVNVSSTGQLGELAALTDGQIYIGSTAVSPVAATLTPGTGIGITNAAGSITVSSSGGGLTWTVVTGTTQAMAVNNGYIADNAGVVTATLPATSAVGDIVRITGINNDTGWKIAQNAGNTIFFGTSTTMPGVGGSLQSAATRDAVELVCTSANANWQVISSIGNITVV